MNARAFLIVSLATSPAFAAPCEQAGPAIAGEPSPCDGQLLPEAWARSGLKCLQIDIPATEARCRLDAEKAQADLLFARGEHDACAAALAKLEEEALGVPTPPPEGAWHEHPLVRAALWVGIFAGGVALGANL